MHSTLGKVKNTSSKTTSPIDCKVGDLFYAVPVHICPTVAKYNAAYVCREHEVKEVWPIEARDYLIHLLYEFYYRRPFRSFYECHGMES